MKRTKVRSGGGLVDSITRENVQLRDQLRRALMRESRIASALLEVVAMAGGRVGVPDQLAEELAADATVRVEFEHNDESGVRVYTVRSEKEKEP